MPSQAEAPALSEADLRAIERLLADFGHAADRLDPAGVAALFLADGELVAGGQRVSGREGVAQDCRTRFARPGRATRHLCTNLRIDPQPSGDVCVAQVQLTFEQAEGTAALWRVSDVDDVLRRDPQGRWRIARRVIRRVMAGSA